MNASLGTASEANLPAASETINDSSRGALVAPIVVIIFISLLTTFVLVWVSGRVLNSNAEAVSTNLVLSMLEFRGESLKDIASDAALNAESAGASAAGPDGAPARVALGEGLAQRHGIVVTMVLNAADGMVQMSQYGQRKPLSVDHVVTPGVRSLLSRVRRAGPGEDASAWGLVQLDQQVSLVAADRIGGAAASADGAAVLVLFQPLAKSFLDRSATEFSLAGLRHIFRTPPEALSRLPLTGIDGGRLGYLVWGSPKPGDVVLWYLMPSLSCALIAVAFLLYQFFRSTDLVLERQSYLLSSLRRERELRTLKTRFVSMMSHELRTPLATIRSAADLLERYEAKMSAEDKRRETEVIRESVDRLAGIIENVLVMGRSDTKAARARDVRLELGTFCEEIWREVSEPLGDTHRLVLSGSAVGRTVSTDDTLLGSVLSNLLQNAIKYSPGRDTVILDINAQDQDCLIDVTDFGPGISAEDQEKIFDAFYRGSTSKASSGTGLGLSVAKAAVERLGGSLTMESELGKGTRFHVELPGLMKNRIRTRRKDET